MSRPTLPARLRALAKLGHPNAARSRRPLLALGLGASALAIAAATGLIVTTSHDAQAGAGPAKAPTAQMIVEKDGSVRIPDGSPLRAKLLVQTVAAQNSAQTTVLPATVETDPAQTVKLASPLTGRVIALKVGLGDQVVQGQVVAVIESADLAQAYDDDDKAASALALAQRSLARQRGLTDARAGAVKDLEAAQDAAVQAESEHRRTQARLRAIGASGAAVKGRLLEIRAPISGSITDLSIANGAFYNDLTQPLMTVARLDPIWVSVAVPEASIAAVAKGETAEITLPAYPGRTLRGQIRTIGDVFDNDTRRAKARIVLANPDRLLKPGMFANVAIQGPATAAPTIPATAIVLKGEADQVFVEVAPWTFQARAVETRQQGDQVVITRGVAPGERVIVKGGVLIND